MNMMKVAIVGCAHGHFGQYCLQWNAHPEWGVTPVKCWDHDAARLERVANNFKLEAVADLDKIIADNDIDAFVVASETSMHADLVEKAAAAGKDIILYKPMALTMRDADRIAQAVTAGVHRYFK